MSSAGDEPKDGKIRAAREATRRRAGELRRDWSEGSAVRQRSLERALLRLDRDRPLVLMVLNAGHAELFANWAASCDVHEVAVRSRSVVFCVDEESADVVNRLGFAAWYDPESCQSISSRAAEVYSDQIFGDMMFPKTFAVNDLLSYGRDVLFQDVDLVWRRDPIPELDRPELQSAHALFMYDGPNPIYAPLHANTGFFLLRNRKAARHFWQQACDSFEEMRAHRSQQVVVNRLLAAPDAERLKVRILDEDTFANGHLFSVEDPVGLPDDPAVIHCSWTHNLDHKLEKLRLANLWFLDDPA